MPSWDLLPSFILHIYYTIDFKECQDKSFEPDEESGHSLPHNFVPCPFLILHIYYTIDFKKSQYPIGLSRDQSGRTIFFLYIYPPFIITYFLIFVKGRSSDLGPGKAHESYSPGSGSR